MTHDRITFAFLYLSWVLSPVDMLPDSSLYAVVVIFINYPGIQTPGKMTHDNNWFTYNDTDLSFEERVSELNVPSDNQLCSLLQEVSGTRGDCFVTGYMQSWAT